MRKISEFLNKEVISLYEAETAGTISGVLFEKKLKKALWLQIIKKGDIVDERLAVPLKCVFKWDSNAIVLKNSAEIVLEDTLDAQAYLKCPLGKNCYSAGGDCLGALSDIEIADNSGSVQQILCESGAYLSEQVVSVSDEMVILKRQGEKIALKNPAKTVKIEKTQDVPVSALHAPKRIVADYGFLLGRKVLYDIFNNKRDKIIYAGSVIKPATVELARRYGKLVELTTFSKK